MLVRTSRGMCVKWVRGVGMSLDAISKHHSLRPNSLYAMPSHIATGGFLSHLARGVPAAHTEAKYGGQCGVRSGFRVPGRKLQHQRSASGRLAYKASGLRGRQSAERERRTFSAVILPQCFLEYQIILMKYQMESILIMSVGEERAS